MPRYTMEVTELIAQTRMYVVEAENVEEAIEKGNSGETESEITLDSNIGVVNRSVELNTVQEEPEE